MGQSNKRQYWLGGDEVSAQDTFFLDALDSKIWSAGTQEQWDACWHTEMPDKGLFEQLGTTKTINHIPGNSSLMIKSNLHQTLSKAKERVSGLPQEQRYGFFPDTYSMPEDYFEFQKVAAENPDWFWIQKPKNLSRGRGIEVVKHPETVPMDSDWIIQRYLSEPHLWDGYKYVLRCYVLVTSVEPLRFYWFHEGFAKLTSEPYSTEDLDNPYRHLTNPDINEDNTDVDVPVVFHSFKTYRKWLQAQGADDEKLFAGLRDLIALTVISARESFRTQSQNVDADTQGTYELIGLDCMVDDDLKPWVLECNLSPSLETCSTSDDKGQEETAIKRQLVNDIVNILGLNDLSKSDELTDQQKATYEQERAGGFQCVFPTEKANDYLNCFPVPRYADIASLPEGTEVDLSKLPLQASEGVEAVFADSLALLYGKKYGKNSSNTKQHFIFPNELATMIWLQNSAGLSPQEIAAELTAVYSSSEGTEIDEKKQLAEIWDVLADWAQANLFVSNDSDTSSETQGLDYNDWANVQTVEHSGVTMTIRSACPIAGLYIESLFKNNLFKNTQTAINIDILRSPYGYTLISGARVVASGQKLSMLAPRILDFISEKCLDDNEDGFAVVQGVVASITGRNTLIMSDSEQLDTWGHQMIADRDNTQILSGSPVLCSEQATVRCTDIPLFLSECHGKTIAIAEKGGEIFHLYKTETEVGSQFKIDTILFLQSINNDETIEAPIQILRNAEVLAKLWESCSHKNPEAASMLPTWLENVQGILVNVSEEDSDRSLASALDALNA